MSPRIDLALATLALAGTLQAQKPSLAIGKPAPALTVEKWIKGSPVARFEKGKIYVVEFWATWCPPCVAGMPHLSGLQKEFGKNDVTVIGVTSADESNTLDKVQEMVSQKGDLMGYTVTWDTERKTSAAFLDASGRSDIPTAFVVDRSGTIAYIGHPMFLDEPLAELVAGTWDLAVDPARLEQDQELFFSLYGTLQSDPKGTEARLVELEKRHPKLGAVTDPLHFSAALAAGNYPEAYTVARRVLAYASAIGDAEDLNQIAWEIVDPEAKIAQRDLELALEAARKAVELSASKDALKLATLARVHASKGDFVQAIGVQTQAVAVAPTYKRIGLTKTLEEYKAKGPQQ